MQVNAFDFSPSRTHSICNHTRGFSSTTDHTLKNKRQDTHIRVIRSRVIKPTLTVSFSFEKPKAHIREFSRSESGTYDRRQQNFRVT